jgi:hypothetical protein
MDLENILATGDGIRGWSLDISTHWSSKSRRPALGTLRLADSLADIRGL